MPHFVFANDNEIASKSADGASIACQPDVCFSPGAPMPGVPIPYPNTVFAKDLDNLSRTVFVKGTGAALENKSFFKTSYGDEPATQAYKKGIISGVIQGKGYFASWSMDVKFEKLGVARHKDLVTHNHGSPANAMVKRYQSVWKNAGGPCRKERQKVLKNCKPKSENDRKKKRKNKKSALNKLKNLASILDEFGERLAGYNRNRNNAWMEDYCDGLWVKPKGTNFDEAKQQIDDFLNQGKMGLIQDAFGKILEMAWDSLSFWDLAGEVGWFAAKALVKNLIGGAAGTTGIGLVVTAGMAAWTVTDIVITARNLANKLGPDAMKYLKDIESADEIIEGLQEKLQKWRESPEALMADVMSIQANADACIRARRCMLIPYNKTSSPQQRITSTRKGDGCCPGQTGHHVMPGDMFGKNAQGVPKNPCTKAYNGSRHANAPTMCLEGADNNNGSHGYAHKKLSEQVQAYRKNNDGDPPMISYPQARNMAVSAIRQVAPQCSAACLKAQLDAFYEDCNKGPGNQNLKATSGSGPGADNPTGKSD